MLKQYFSRAPLLALLLLALGATPVAAQNVGIGTTTPGSRLTVNGSFAAGYAAVTAATYAVLDNDYYVVWTGNAAGTFTLPPAVAGNRGRVYKIRNNTALFNLTLAPSGGVLIDGLAGLGVPAGQAVELIANGNTSGTAWEVVGLVLTSLPPAGAGASAGTIGGAGGACSPAPTAVGSFLTTTPTTSQSLAVTVNVATPGAYAIGTNTVNGLSFFATGYLVATGVQTVPLYAFGTPLAGGTFPYTVAYGSSLCTTSVSVTPVAAFNCTGTTQTFSPGGPLTNGNPYTGSYTVPYTAGSGLSYPATAQTVSGLTLTRTAGTYAAGGGNVVYNLTGTYTGATNGTVTFTPPECGPVTYLGDGPVATFSCAGTAQTFSPGGPITNGSAYTGSYTVPYTAGSNLPYPATTQTVSGLTLTRTAGTYAPGGGTIVYNLTGTYTGATNGTVTYTTPECGSVAFVSTPIATFNCAATTQTFSPRGPITNGSAYTGSYTVPYTAGSNLPYPATAQTVSGLTLTRTAGTYAPGGGNVVYTVSGTYTGATNGSVTFTPSECGSVTFVSTPSATFNCAGATQSLSPAGNFTNGTAYTGSYTVPYTAGNGLTYPTTTQTVSGLTLTRTAGTYAAGGGNVVYTVSGTYTGATNGSASFTTTECSSVTFFGDAIRVALASAGCPSCAAYDAAAVNSWVATTAAEYAAVLSNISGMGAFGSSTNDMNTSAAGGIQANYTVTVNTTTQSLLPAATYPVALSVRTGLGTPSTMAGLKLKVSSTSQTAGYADLPAGAATPSVPTPTANTRYYFVLKRPTTLTDPAASYLAFFSPQDNQVGLLRSSGFWAYRNGDANNTCCSQSQSSPMFQVLATPTKQW